MKQIHLILLGATALMLVYCGGAGEENIKADKKVKNTPLSEVSSSAAPAPGIRITGIKFGNTVDVLNDLIAEPVLSDTNAVLELSYRWFVNDNEIPGENGDTLPSEYFKEGDWVHCRVAEDNSESSIPEFTSNRIQVLGPIPIIHKTPQNNFTFPGIFAYRIIATMPNMDDLDPDFDEEDESNPEKAIKFELVSPLGKGVMLNSVTGEITWNITEELITELGNQIEIKFNVISPGGRKVSSSITLNLEKGEAESPESDDNTSLGTEIE